jgi:hypothetical protein
MHISSWISGDCKTNLGIPDVPSAAPLTASSVQTYLVIVIASIPFIRPLFMNSKAFSLSYYRSLLAKHSRRSQTSESDRRQPSRDSDETLYDKNQKPLPSLPHIPKDRFITTTLRNVGMESNFDRLSCMEDGTLPEEESSAASAKKNSSAASMRK